MILRMDYLRSLPSAIAGLALALAASAHARETIVEEDPAQEEFAVQEIAPLERPVVGAYFVEWGVYGRAFGVDKVPFDKITHLLYAFIPICDTNKSLQDMNPSGHAILQQECAGKKRFEITVHDTWAALGSVHNNFGKLAAAKAAHPDVTILPSIGGWSLSDPFHELASTAANRKVFVDSCIAFLEKYSFFDGLDIDWEYPGGGGANLSLGGSSDREGYNQLMRDLRAALDSLGARKGRTYYLTSAVGAAPAKIDSVDYRSLFSGARPTIDLIFAMTYDYYGAWNGVRGHASGLFEGNHQLEVGFSGADTVRNLLAAGVPASRLALGVAMYGRAWEGIQSGQALSTSKGDSSGRPFSLETGMWESGVMDYKFIAQRYRNDPAYEYHFDGKAKAPYLWSPSLRKLISYEDPCSVRAKVEFAKSLGLAGTFGWEIDADNGELLNVMNGALPSCP